MKRGSTATQGSGKRHRGGDTSTSDDSDTKTDEKVHTSGWKPLLASTIMWPGMPSKAVAFAFESLEELQRRADIDEFVQVSPKEIAECWHASSRLVDEGIAAQFLRNGILGGGMCFQFGDESISREKAEVTKELVPLWAGFAEKLLRSRWDVGFAAVAWELHPKYGGIPYILELDQLDVYHHCNILGRHSYLYRRKSSFDALNGGAAIKRAIGTGSSLEDIGFLPGILTFTEIGHAPLRNGRLCSKITKCTMDRPVRKIRNALRMVAEAAGVIPTLITEALPDDNSQDGLGQEATQELSERREEELARTKESLAYYQNRAPKDSASAILDPDKDGSGIRGNKRTPGNEHELLKQISSRDFPRIDLPAGRRSAGAPPCTVPLGVDEMNATHADKVCEVWGISPAVLRPAAMGAHAAAAVAAERLNSGTLLCAKAELEGILTETWHAIHDEMQLAEYAAKTPIAEKLTPDGAAKALYMKIGIPGMPSPDISEKVYDKGILKYTAYQRILQTNYGFGAGDFNPVAKPPPTEFEMPKPKPVGAAGGGKKKPKAKAKKKKKKKKPTKAAAVATITDEDDKEEEESVIVT